MSRKQFDEKELEVVGSYPGIENDLFADWGMPTIPASPKYNRPITPRENWRLFFEGKKPYWIPEYNWYMADTQDFRPRQHPDNLVTHLVFDGGGIIPYEKNVMHSDWFDLDWVYVPEAGGATVKPGDPKVPDITHWEDYVSMPDLDRFDWDGCVEMNRDYLTTDKCNLLSILSGFWERLMAVMDVQNAAMALIDEDEQEGVHRFFDKYADVLCDYISRMKKLFPLDAVLIHDDWGHQNGPFFSIETCREMLVPYLKRVTDHVHSLGMGFLLHSCGKNERLVPCYIEAGVDVWTPQEINDVYMLVEKYKDQPIGFGLWDDPIPEGATEEEIDRLAKEWVDRIKDYRVVISYTDAPEAYKQAVYKYTRLAWQDEQ